MPFLCFFMAFGHTKENYIEIVCRVSTYRNYLSYQEAFPEDKYTL